MWATLTLMGALSMAPAQAGELKLTNGRATYGLLGPTRSDKTFLQGDVNFVNFDIEGLTFKEGQAKYNIKLELLDKNGVGQFKNNPDEDRDLYAIQGPGRVPARAFVPIGTDTKPGTYTLKLTVTDKNANPPTQATLSRDFEVAGKDFGIIRLNFTYDLNAFNPAPAVGVVGQTIFLHFAVSGFTRDPKTKQPKVQFSMRMLDAEGKPTLAKPVEGAFPTKEDQIPEEASVVPLWFPLGLTRPGKYTIELSATDQLNMKTSTIKLPLEVIEPPK
jgi:hypothetical protein